MEIQKIIEMLGTMNRIDFDEGKYQIKAYKMFDKVRIDVSIIKENDLEDVPLPLDM